MSSEREQHISDDRPEGDVRAIQYLKEAITNGEHWYLALLKAIKLWSSAEEDFNGRHYCYLIDGEAFDWLLLAERLCSEVSGVIPEKERIELLFFDRPPLELSKEKFRGLMGTAKYRAYLNFLYGVLVEEALLMAVVDDIRKERRAFSSHACEDELDQAFNRVYGASRRVLLDEFRNEKQYPKRKFTSLGELKELTYWLFKYRLKHCDKSRMASDTKKALLYMQHNLAIKKLALS